VFPTGVDAELVRCEVIDVDDIENLGVVVAEQRRIGLAEDAEMLCL
jgi:hypothetical protein